MKFIQIAIGMSMGGDSTSMDSDEALFGLDDSGRIWERRVRSWYDKEKKQRTHEISWQLIELPEEKIV